MSLYDINNNDNDNDDYVDEWLEQKEYFDATEVITEEVQAICHLKLSENYKNFARLLLREGITNEQEYFSSYMKSQEKTLTDCLDLKLMFENRIPPLDDDEKDDDSNKEEEEEEEEEDEDEDEDEDVVEEEEYEEIVYHITWCYICGEKERLIECISCCAAFHRKCMDKKWRISINKSRLSKCQLLILNDVRNSCYQCVWGPSFKFGDVVWHKMKNAPWWPARILMSDNIPENVDRQPTDSHRCLLFYGENNYTWVLPKQLCSFAINHDALLSRTSDAMLVEAINAAADDYVASLSF